MQSDNPIAMLNEHCQKCKLPNAEFTFKQVSATPSIWESLVSLDEYHALGGGATKQEAKANASEKLQSALRAEKIWWTQLFSTPLPKDVHPHNDRLKENQKYGNRIDS